MLLLYDMLLTFFLQYMHQRTTRRAVVMVALVWVASLCISVPPLFGWRTAQDVADPLVCRISQVSSHLPYKELRR